MAAKIFNDPIHGSIELPSVCVRIIDTPQFQRLRNIKQLGGAYYVYPGASHNRFEHSIGVCHLAGKLVKKLNRSQPELGITKEDVMCVQIAGLCHDLGHGPFSHLFDKYFIPHPQVDPNSTWKHEESSLKMFEYMLEDPRNEKLKDEFTKWFEENVELHKTFIKELIDRPKLPADRQSHRPDFLYEIVANKRNSVDVDKWDYFARDSLHLGMHNNFDHKRLIKFARVIEVDEEVEVDGKKEKVKQKQICYRDKEAHSLYEMFHTREMLHRRAYQHKTTLIVEYMINEALVKANNSHLKFKGKAGAMLKMSKCITDQVAFTKLDDSVFQTILNDDNDDLAEARKILEDIQSRNLLRYIDKRRPEPFLGELNDLKKSIKDKFDELHKTDAEQYCSSDSIVMTVAQFDYGMKAKKPTQETGHTDDDLNPINKVRFYSKFEPDKAFKLEKEDVSSMLPGNFNDKIIYFYHTDTCTKEIAKTSIDTAWQKVVDDELKKRKVKTGEEGTGQ